MNDQGPSAVSVPKDIREHCENHRLCAGCPLKGGLCVAPLADYGDPRWAAWIEKVSAEVRRYSASREGKR